MPLMVGGPVGICACCLEECESGRIGRSRKLLWLQGHRGFESHLLRANPCSSSLYVQFASRLKPLADIFPVDYRPQSVDEVCPYITVMEVVSMFPYVEHQ